MFIDEKLNWKRHINYVSGKISRGIGIILKARKSLNRDSLITLYHSFIYPYYTYCNHVWGATYASNLRNLVLLQKRCVRIICNVKPREHTENLFKELGFLRFEDINKYMIGRFMHRWYNRKLPEMFNEYFEYVRDVHNYATRQSINLYVPYVRTNLGQSCISYRGPKIWNCIINDKINGDSSEAVFSKMLKQAIKNGTIDISKCNWYSADIYQV